MPLPDAQEVARYLRIEDILDEEPEEEAFLNDLIEIAVEDLEDSGIKDQTTKRYGMAIKLMVANLYEERRPQVVGTITSNLNYSLERIILQLKARELPEREE
ncbi:head-tail connector protein [Oceanobacillus kimchii]|uniref:head-tail connector protein n=1 Tax=Oceanobacillus kimchii TaxID=746691 RepID=UPI0021A2FC6E|nr:head-tail connector protein [Oceanobacillus kimchii]MCT1575695.1 head-tail connector protein [Oceanobacillus kimchii]MCT2137325.1 head-tail connector protein [Oceanobacillus kimchii]